MDSTRKIIAEHLAISNKLEVAEKEVDEKNESSSIRDTATKYGLEYYDLWRKIDLRKQRKEFDDKKSKYDVAIQEIFEGDSVKYVSDRYKINKSKLYKEANKARAQGIEKYKYDGKIKCGTKYEFAFTYVEEELLFGALMNWAIREPSESCICQLCVLERLLTLAYEFARDNNIKYPSYWKLNKKADVIFLKDFEMRHSDKISRAYAPLGNCSRQI